MRRLSRNLVASRKSEERYQLPEVVTSSLVATFVSVGGIYDVDGSHRVVWLLAFDFTLVISSSSRVADWEVERASQYVLIV